MYTENRLRDCALFVKAVLSNQLARVSPTLYMRLTHETGRGKTEDSTDEVAAYFSTCFAEYCQRLGWTPEAVAGQLQNKVVLEYGPGDSLGVALLWYAHGAKQVHCVDRFPLQSVSARNAKIYSRLVQGLDGEAQRRANSAFRISGDPSSGFRPEAIEYFVMPDGLIGEGAKYDLVVSRAVLEHVNDLASTMTNIATALHPQGVSIHEVDLRSHGLDRYQPFDFLTWPDFAYHLMFSQKGFPNRWRVDKYRELAAANHLHLTSIEPTMTLSPQQVQRIAPKLANHLRRVSAEELSWMGFWMVLRHKSA